MLHSACIDGKHTEKQYSKLCKSQLPILWFPYVKIAEKGTLFIFGQKTEKVVSNQATLAFIFFTSLTKILFYLPSFLWI